MDMEQGTSFLHSLKGNSKGSYLPYHPVITSVIQDNDFLGHVRTQLTSALRVPEAYLHSTSAIRGMVSDTLQRYNIDPNTRANVMAIDYSNGIATIQLEYTDPRPIESVQIDFNVGDYDAP